MEPSQVRSFLELLWSPGEVREVRIPRHNDHGHTASGYFDSVEPLIEAVAPWDGRANVYVSLNPVQPSLLSRAKNRIDPRASKTTADKHITRRRWLFVDIDAVRPSKTSSTELELGAAKDTLRRLTDFLAELGWPEPVTAMSGNGCYALYAIDLPNDAVATQTVKGVLNYLTHQFDSNKVHVDTTVYNAARIIGLVGTMKVKGTSTADRPHRRSQLLSVPEVLAPVPIDKLRELADRTGHEATPSGTASSGHGSPVILEELLVKYGIEFRTQPPDASGITWYHVRQCPFHDDGRPFECGAGQVLPNGRLAGKCFHPEGDGKGWQEWKRALGIEIGTPADAMGRSRPWDADSADVDSDGLRLSDTWNGRRLVADNQGDILWCEVFKQWFVWDGTRFRRDDTREVERRAERTVTSLYTFAGTLADRGNRQKLAEWALQSESRHRITNMVESAKRMVPVHPNQFDTDLMTFNTLNGTIDLRTQAVRPHSRDDLLTKRAEVRFDAAASCPLWLGFLDRIFAGNEQVIRFVQRLFGYCLTGLTDEQFIVILYGTGANGKSTLLGVLRRLCGEYAHHCRPEVFTAKRNDSQGFELVPLAGARVVTATETGAGRRLDEALLKEMTGGEPLTCAPKYGDFFTFQPVFKPLLATNHKPEIKGVDEGIWRRVILLPFTVTIPTPERDKALGDKLELELSGVLNWALAGLDDYLRNGLDVPGEVMAATQDYRSEQDLLGGWIDDNCMLTPEVSDEFAALYEDYVAWCEKNSEEAVNRSRFSSSLEERGCPARRGTKGKRLRDGICRVSAFGVTG